MSAYNQIKCAHRLDALAARILRWLGLVASWRPGRWRRELPVSSELLALGLGTRLFDAYSVANNVPNIVFDLVIGGVLTSVAVPLLVRAHLSDRDAGEAYDAKLLATVFYLLSLAVAASVLAAPLIVDIYASGFTTSEHHVAVTLTRFFLPQVLFYGLGSTMAAIINAQGRFGLPAWAPVANNVIVTAAALMYILVGGTGSVTAISTSELVVLGLGTTLGIAAQAAILAPSLRRRGGGWLRAFDPRRLGDRHAMLRALRLAGWVSLYALANQVSLIIVTRLSTGAGEGSFGTFTNAYTLFQLPYAVVAVSIITTLAPRISRHAATGNQVRLTADISRAMRTACCILLPTTVLFLLLGPALATVLFTQSLTYAFSPSFFSPTATPLRRPSMPLEASWLFSAWRSCPSLPSRSWWPSFTPSGIAAPRPSSTSPPTPLGSLSSLPPHWHSRRATETWGLRSAT